MRGMKVLLLLGAVSLLGFRFYMILRSLLKTILDIIYSPKKPFNALGILS
jgi:hypothetical protein